MSKKKHLKNWIENTSKLKDKWKEKKQTTYYNSKWAVNFMPIMDFL